MNKPEFSKIYLGLETKDLNHEIISDYRIEDDDILYVPFEFVKWYSGMSSDKIIKALEKWEQKEQLTKED